MKLASISFMNVICVQVVMSCEFGCHTFQSLGKLLHHALLNGFDGEGFRQLYTIRTLFAVVMMLQCERYSGRDSVWHVLVPKSATYVALN